MHQRWPCAAGSGHSVVAAISGYNVDEMEVTSSPQSPSPPGQPPSEVRPDMAEPGMDCMSTVLVCGPQMVSFQVQTTSMPSLPHDWKYTYKIHHDYKHI